MTEFLHRGSDKKSQNRNLFNAIAHRYDFLNHFLSAGIDYSWRRKLAKSLPDQLDGPLLDVATGTGDLAFTILKHRPNTEIIGLDFSANMLAVARHKMMEKGIEFETVEGDAENLPFDDNKFSALTIAFGFRNIGHFDVALNQFYRVLKPGGELAILEMGHPTVPVLGTMFEFYFHKILPIIGTWISGSEAYRYLPESVTNYPPREELISMVQEAGFEQTQLRNFTGGVVTLLRAQKPV